ncbi:flavin reductase [Paraburkholderia sp. ZP32-5]|uniref:flavin reductase n=1 Tax=Paraburkholderia sp. ZP32-5 TaxID=2883245 RepID=UPI001F3C28B5|nr:flavin reductase [Paraburkholderia sp. ZP32-5]
MSTDILAGSATGSPVIDASGYRDAMARLGAAVHIVTSSGAAGVVGLTASAVCSVTDAPPTLLVCLNRKSSAHDALISNRVLCVNTLGAKHEDLSRRFASGVPMAERFGGANWHVMETGSPVLGDALVAFDCRIISSIRQGTHSVLLCEVARTRVDGAAEPGLMYFARRYHRVGAEQHAASN